LGTLENLGEHVGNKVELSWEHSGNPKKSNIPPSPKRRKRKPEECIVHGV
jgi:hypothetical protein